MTEETKPPLLKCIAKKSTSVTMELVLWVSIGVVAVSILCALYWVAKILQVYVIPPMLSAISVVPWFAWWILAAILCIVGYSTAWCINRELTRSDYFSDAVNTSAISCIIASLALAFSGGVYGLSTNSPLVTIALAFPLIAVIVSILTDDGKQIEFPGAVWNHYVTGRKP